MNPLTIIAWLMAFGLSLSAAAAGVDQLGDLDGDGVATVRDLVLLRGHMNKTQPLSEEKAVLADLNKDGFVNQSDVDELVKEILQTRTPETLPLATVRESSPASGEGDVALTRETVVQFTIPLAADTALDTTKFYATFGGRKVLSRTDVSGDRKSVTLFYLEPLPSSARVSVTLSGGLKDLLGREVDLDGDGMGGGSLVTSFDTLSNTGVLGTGVQGYVYASEPGAGGLNIPLPGVTITVDGAEETLRTTTGADGHFLLSPSPVGSFFVKIDGHTCTIPGLSWPNGDYYPEVGKKWTAIAGTLETWAVAGGNIYLPLVKAGSLQTVSNTQNTTIGFPQTVADTWAGGNDEMRDILRQVTITVPANSLFRDENIRGGQVGLAPVASDRLPEPLPGGLTHKWDISIQTSGGTNFDQPAPVKFPNLPDPITGEVLRPGEKSALVSFNHDTGQWEIAAPMTVSEDGRFLISDAGAGVRQPGWHGTSQTAEVEGGNFEEDNPSASGDPNDIDGDGTPNSSDADVDGDGTPNGSDADVDGDGTPNGSDADVDGDGTPNGSDPDIDGDGQPNESDPDMDGDGIPNASDPDRDGDGIPNDQDTSDGPSNVCPVTHLPVHVDNGTGSLKAQLLDAKARFLALVRAEPGAYVEEGDDYLSLEYQQHLFDVRNTFVALDNLPGIDGYFESPNGTPLLSIAPDSPHAACEESVQAINDEVRRHHLLVSPQAMAPDVDDPNSLPSAAHRAGNAFDVIVIGVSEPRMDALAAQCGLYRPSQHARGYHFELLPVQLAAQFITPSGDPVLAPLDDGGIANNTDTTPDGANEFTFSTQTPGVLTLRLKARVPGISSLPQAVHNQLEFLLVPIGNSTFSWHPSNPGGKVKVANDIVTATAIYTGLPNDNSAFGMKPVALAYNGTPIGSAKFEVFFPRDADNHPGTTAPFDYREPNWFYYWKQLMPGHDLNYGGPSVAGVNGSVSAWTSILGINYSFWLNYLFPAEKSKIILYQGVCRKGRAYGVANELSGIDYFCGAVIHEARHVEQFALADGLVPTGQLGSPWRYGWSYKTGLSDTTNPPTLINHNHWSMGPDNKPGVAGVDDDGDGELDNLLESGPGELGRGDDISLAHPTSHDRDWPKAWALPDPNKVAQSEFESDAVNAQDQLHFENKRARDDWANPGKNHHILDKWDD